MTDKNSLMVLRCPACGASLKAKNTTEPVTCVYCDSTVVPVVETSRGNQIDNAGANVRVEGIRTSSSALAYMEQFFEEYDWDSFAYAQSLSIGEIDRLASALKASAADDKNTWIACFQAVSVPYLHKIEGCKQILSAVIEEYKLDSLDAYSQFDAYKRVMAMMVSRREEILSKLEKFTGYAEKYGASAGAINELKEQTARVTEFGKVHPFTSVKDIPQIQEFDREKDAKIVARLAEQGINAKTEYDRAKSLIENKQYVEALNVLLTLQGYSDTNALIEKIDKYYLILDVLEIEGNLYYYREDPRSDKLGLYPTADGKVTDKAIIRNIGKIITNYADILYYLDTSGKAKRYSLSTKQETKLFDKRLDKDSVYVYGKKAFLRTAKDIDSDNESGAVCDIVALDLVTGAVNVFIKNAKNIVALRGNKLIYQVVAKKEGQDDQSAKVISKVINVDTKQVVEVGGKNVTIHGFVGEQVVYTRQAPNEFNRDLYIKPMEKDNPERLIEKNVYQFCSIIAEKLFYYIGNVHNQSLININCDGTGRREWPQFIQEVLLEQGGWVYFIRKAGYNAVLCRARLDGSRYRIIAADIEKFIKIKNGYLYYINGDSSLVMVRMDGSNLQELCDDVETVLSVREDKIVFVSVDGRIKTGEYEQTTKVIKSIYAVNFNGSGKIKLAYDVKRAKEYDENTVYYITEKDRLETLYKLDVETDRGEKLLDLQVMEETRKFPGFAVAVVVAVLAIFCAMIAFCAEAVGVGLFFMMLGIVSAIIAAMIKLGNIL